MQILISFNNTYQSPGYPVLGVLDTVSLNLRFVKLMDNIPETGILGLAVSSKYIFAAVQYAFDASQSYRVPPEIGVQYGADGKLASLYPCSLLILDKISLAVVHHYLFEEVKDVHSFLLSPDEKILYVVSTGTDEVMKMNLHGSSVGKETVFWKPPTFTDRADNHHLNSIVEWNGDILVSGFGQKENPDDWNSARNGFIYNISRNEFVVQGLLQPHSLCIAEGRLAFCESKQKQVRFIDVDGKERMPPIQVGGYSRGLCAIGEELFIGTSARRQKSKSTGKPVMNVEGLDVGCTLTKVSKDGSLETIHLASFANEIYEMIPVDNTSSWPFKPPINYKEKFQQAWQYQTNIAIDEINHYAVDGAPLIILDEWSLGISPHHFPGKEVHDMIEKDGHAWGPPESDEEAVRALKELEEKHDKFVIAFAWPTFWWLDTFQNFRLHLERDYEQPFSNHRIKMFVKK